MIALLMSTDWGKNNFVLAIALGVLADLLLGFLLSKILLMVL